MVVEYLIPGVPGRWRAVALWPGGIGSPGAPASRWLRFGWHGYGLDPSWQPPLQ